MSEKVVGYILLAVGILIILVSAVSVVSVFTGQAKPVQLFNFPGISLDTSGALKSALPEELRGSVKIPETKTEVISSEMINFPSNLFAHLFLMGFVAGVGQKLASLGVQLVRPIVVKLRTKEGETTA